MSDSDSTFVAPVHVHSGAWWASSHGNARRTALGATASIVLLALISWLIWVSPSDNAVRSAVQTAVNAAPTSNTTTLKADRSALMDQLLTAKRQLADSKAAMADVQQQAWSSEAQLAEAQSQLASARSAVAQAQQAADGSNAGGDTGTVVVGGSGDGPASGSPGGPAGGTGSDDGSGSGSGSGDGGPDADDATGPVPVTAPPLSELIAPTARYFGLYTQQAPFNWATYDDTSSKVGVSPNMVGYFSGFDEDFRSDAVQRSWAKGEMPLLTWESRPIADANDVTSSPDYSLPKIIDGDFDAYLTTYAQDIVATGLPLALRLDHEMNSTWYPWNEDDGHGNGINGNRPGDYVRMWQHVHDVFEANGANEYVAWVWSPNRVNRLTKTHKTLEYTASLYPGDDYVDWVGMSGYSRPPYDEGAVSFDQTFGDTLDQLRRISDKPILLSEIGASETGGNKAAWIDTLFDALADPANDDIIGFSWFSLAVTGFTEGERMTNDWRIDSRSDSTEAFREGIGRTDIGYRLERIPT